MNARTRIWMVITEACLGIVLGLPLAKYFDQYENVLGADYILSPIKYIVYVSGVFFVAVYSVGLPMAHKLKRGRSVKHAILYSLYFWILSVLIAIMVEPTFGYFSVLIFLSGIIFGFNIGLGLG